MTSGSPAADVAQRATARSGQRRGRAKRLDRRRGAGRSGGAITIVQIFLEPNDFVVRQAGQRRALAGDAGLGAEFDQLFAVDLEFFG